MALTRITFPYLALVSMETLFAGILNANQQICRRGRRADAAQCVADRDAAARALFPKRGLRRRLGRAHRRRGAVVLVAVDAEMRGVGIRFRMPQLDPTTRRFLKALGPAIVGAGGVQLALFADTLIASFLPTGALSALYYADRINQLPIGVVGIAVGTVLLPEMSRRLAAGDARGAALAQARGIQLALLMTVPSVAGAIAIPDLIMRALFARGAFTAADAAAAGATLAAYAIGLLPFVMMRSFTAPFYARGDTLTPVKAALLAAAVNIALKVVLMGPLAQVGLALATSVGAWINLTPAHHLRQAPRLCRVGCGASPGGQAVPGGRRARRRALFRQYRAGQAPSPGSLISARRLRSRFSSSSAPSSMRQRCCCCSAAAGSPACSRMSAPLPMRRRRKRCSRLTPLRRRRRCPTTTPPPNV